MVKNFNASFSCSEFWHYWYRVIATDGQICANAVVSCIALCVHVIRLLITLSKYVTISWLWEKHHICSVIIFFV